MKPALWGPHAWYFLHSVTLSYPNRPATSEKNQMKRFLLELQNTLPCGTCRQNYKHHLVKRPLNLKVLSSRRTLFNWLVDIHNDVNKMLKKPTLSYEEALKIYEKN